MEEIDNINEDGIKTPLINEKENDEGKNKKEENKKEEIIDEEKIDEEKIEENKKEENNKNEEKKEEEKKDEENKENIKEKIFINEDNKENNIIIPKKEENNIIIPKKENIIDENLNINNNQNYPHQEILEHIITIKYSKILKIPYFIFGNIFHFYLPFKRFPSDQIRLSEMPTPPFAVVRKECK